MMSKVIILCSLVILIQEITGQCLNSNNFQNGIFGNNYASNIAPNSLGPNFYGANSFGANNLNNVATNIAATNNLGLGNYAPNAASINIGQNLAANSVITATNTASTPVSAGLVDGLTASNGGLFSVISSSPIYPTGLSVFSDNLLIEGPLAVTGQLPFLSTVAVEGSLASSGQGAVGCGCGDGNIGIVNELNNAGLYGGINRSAFGRFY